MEILTKRARRLYWSNEQKLHGSQFLPTITTHLSAGIINETAGSITSNTMWGMF
jgi:hypothetical protein